MEKVETLSAAFWENAYNMCHNIQDFYFYCGFKKKGSEKSKTKILTEKKPSETEKKEKKGIQSKTKK